jgi:predicted metal-dependent enzyme (double-stranded beta helix superfamily)
MASILLSGKNKDTVLAEAAAMVVKATEQFVAIRELLSAEDSTKLDEMLKE